MHKCAICHAGGGVANWYRYGNGYAHGGCIARKIVKAELVVEAARKVAEQHHLPVQDYDSDAVDRMIVAIAAYDGKDGSDDS